MRATPLAVTALAAAFLLTACSDDGGGSGSGSGKERDVQESTKPGAPCKMHNVTVQVGPANTAPAAGDTGNLPVTIINRDAECTLDGLPAADLDTGASTSTVPVDKAAKSQKLTLAKDTGVSFTLTYVRGEEGAGKSLAAKTLKVYLPGDTSPRDFPWGYGVVALKSGSEPDASLSGFTQAGD
ncbi:DUF4232 domain-containing protein [Streptomyces sp. GESEQ-35]|uniref:DUF4232 domain-containing protein n=1 Tax=Streptomyces sp. GESEQ-35 TaxID=2812657 RepID=UPI001B3349DB|nr:DUF4232 domain-containing protein [Streptomyces sp. GESEQ-35]